MVAPCNIFVNHRLTKTIKSAIVEPREVEGWLRSFKAGDKKDPAFRKRLVETFVARVDVYKDKTVIYYNITEKRAASGVRIRPVTWSSRNGIRTPGKPFVYGKYYILIVPFSHAA